MEIKTHQYSLLAVSRFNVYVLEVAENTACQKIYILKSQYAIKTAMIATISSCQSYHVIIACRTTLWKICVPGEKQETDDESARSSKRRKYEEVPTGQEDIFADLLDLKERQSSEDSKLFQPELSSQQNAFPLSIGENQRLCDLDAEIMDIVVCEEILVVLVECEDVAYIKVFILEGNQAKCIQSFATGVEKKLFFQDSISSSPKLLYLVMNEGAKGIHTTTQTLAIPTSLFTLLFGKEAACLRSPVVFICDVQGCVYFFRIKSLVPQTKRLIMLCQANSRIVSISRIEFDSLPEKVALKNEDAISLLESALEKDRRGCEHEETSPIIGLLCVSDTGQCYVFLPREVATEVLMFYLPHSTHSCIVSGHHLLYTTRKSVEVCDVTLTRQRDSRINLALQPKFSFHVERVMCLVSVAQDCNSRKDLIIGVTDELKLIHLPFFQDKLADTAQADSNTKSFEKRNLNCIPCFSEDTSAAHNLMDSCLLQLNLFATILKQQRNVCDAGQLEEEEILVSCKCNVSSKPSIPFIFFQVQLTNNTNVEFTKDWKVDVCVFQKAENVSTDLRHFIFPILYALSPNSSEELNIPISRPSGSNFRPYHMTVSLVLSLDLTFTSTQKWISHAQKPLSVKIHEQVFDALDYLQHVNYITPALGKSDESLSNTLQDNGNTVCSDLAKCLLTIPRSRTDKTLEEESKQIGSTSLSVTIPVPTIICEKLNLQSAEDVIKLFMNQGRNAQANPIPLAQIHLKTIVDNTMIYISVSENPNPVSKANSVADDAKSEQKVLTYLVKLRSPNLSLLMAVRASVKARLEERHHLAKGNKHETLQAPFPRVMLNQHLHHYE
ncbi:hypothetical protein RRG08_000944 [Elysia crispata]|nr:hypothetical protein RRG08_000944 [Elysia crispata]